MAEDLILRVFSLTATGFPSGPTAVTFTIKSSLIIAFSSLIIRTPKSAPVPEDSVRGNDPTIPRFVVSLSPEVFLPIRAAGGKTSAGLYLGKIVPSLVLVPPVSCIETVPSTLAPEIFFLISSILVIVIDLSAAVPGNVNLGFFAEF